ncbi:MAG TPA: TIGR01777 family oxidoreductase [Oligoflexia bacterium]|nr:TIGR01777 family oxidoreductase [Oligoflexia bacterium]HMP27298.1 TIGR01777 family oxidoreductase [Oligoflexia bacterium]
MKILITGSSGTIGTKLIPYLRQQDHDITRLVRSDPKSNDIFWNPNKNQLNSKQIEGFDGVIHLAGENIATKRWTNKQKEIIRDSRVNSTKLLCETLASLENPPKVLISASAIGYYGDRGDDQLDETSPPGDNYLAETCWLWEQETKPAEKKGIRVVILRTGIVLTPTGGALKKMLPAFKLGAGAIFGNGSQFMSWISIDDQLEIINYLLKEETISGPVNAVAPNPATNKEFAETISKILSKPLFLKIPPLVVKLIFGEMGTALLLSSQQVKPTVLLNNGYKFKHPTLETALRSLLAAPPHFKK